MHGPCPMSRREVKTCIAVAMTCAQFSLVRSNYFLLPLTTQSSALASKFKGLFGHFRLARPPSYDDAL